MKQCSKCGLFKSKDEFYCHNTTSDGLKSSCKLCVRPAMRNSHLKRKYGITAFEYDEMLAKQGGCCAICGTDEAPTTRGGNKVFYVDHDHSTNKIRSLLCRECNNAIGALKDDPELMRRAAEYVEKHRANS